jgi:threonyl-tRNA synthetase
MIILGKKEAEAGKISVRSRANKALENISSTEDFITSLLEIINTKKLPDNQQS